MRTTTNNRLNAQPRKGLKDDSAVIPSTIELVAQPKEIPDYSIPTEIQVIRTHDNPNTGRGAPYPMATHHESRSTSVEPECPHEDPSERHCEKPPLAQIEFQTYNNKNREDSDIVLAVESHSNPRDSPENNTYNGSPLNPIAEAKKSTASISTLIPMAATTNEEEDGLMDSSYQSALTALLQHTPDDTTQQEHLKLQQDDKGYPEQDHIRHRGRNQKGSNTRSPQSSYTDQQLLVFQNNSSMSMIFPDSVGLAKAYSDRTMSTTDMSSSGDNHHRGSLTINRPTAKVA